MNIRGLPLLAHRYLGLALLLFVCSAGLTGSLLVFRHELDYALNADVVRVQAGGKRLTVAEMVIALAIQRPGASVEQFVVGKGPDRAWLFTLAGHRNGQAVVTDVWIDPYTGRITGQRNPTETGLDRRHLMTTIWKWHSSLLMGTGGKTLGGILAILWVGLSCIGVYLALQRGLRNALRIKANGSGFRAIYDGHRAVGLATVLILSASLLTAINLALPDASRQLISALASTRPRLPQSLPDRPERETRIEFENALEIGRRAMPDAVLTGLVAYHGKGVYLVRFRTAGDIAVTHGTGRVIVDMADGTVLHRESAADTGAPGNTLITWMYPLHSGQAFGTPGRLFIMAVGLVPVLLSLTGFWIWRQKRRNLKPGSALQRSR
ncbi:PepSY-associated TM helix domain-containing protein [Massilia cavernae]|uniref:PepSY domain-containing protein n=1 Tax=Massilia cavernae TaxID=2320864 RepID=A0A418XR34_9BURK|nr:PepSY-associated TM helix domain-containing protein [Massilia cavernae]RJG14876.1 hypothetical protein D3872_15795 [Massilia cavernae]